ncbi:MAG: hypothetical protein ACM3YE_04510, partial [Bacteroidota bacterium]
MKKSFGLIMVTLMVFSAAGVEAGGQNYVYHSVTKDVVVTVNEKVAIKEEETVDIVSFDNGMIVQTILDQELATEKWEIDNKREGTCLTAQRSDNSIVIKGDFKGKKITKELKIDSRPWYQAWNLPFGRFVLAGRDQQEFWALRESDLKEFVMVVLREKEETIELNGQVVEAVKVKVTLNNWMSKFWKVHYWFRKS